MTDKSGKTVEFRLKSTASSDYLHNIMILAGPSVNMADFTTPVRLIRDTNRPPGSDENNKNMEEEPDEEDKNIGRRKRKTRLIQQEEDDEQVTLRNQEKSPWLLEDFDGQHSYISQLLSPESKYVIFVNHGNEFRVVPVSKWYKFTPKLTYRPLTIEEAEEKMASKGRNEDYDRWLMRKRSNSSYSGSGSQSSSGSSSVTTEKSLNKSNTAKMATRIVNLGEEGFDFEEFVDDDDGEDLYNRGGNGGEDEDPTMPRFEKAQPIKVRKNLTDAGKQVKKLVKNLDVNNYYYDSGDEDKDPYAEDAGILYSSEEETLPIEKEREREKNLAQTQKQTKIAPRSLQPQRSIDSMKRARSKSPDHSRSRSKSPQPSSIRKIDGTSGSGAQSPPPKSPTLSSTKLTEEEIISILKSNPMKTKDLISKVKTKLKADPQNKDIFKEIVRKVATVKSSTSQDDDKLLELKPEYR